MCVLNAQTGVQGAEPPGVFHVENRAIFASEIVRGDPWLSNEGSNVPNRRVVFEINRFLVAPFFYKKTMICVKFLGLNGLSKYQKC